MKDKIEIYDLNSEMITIDRIKNFYEKVEEDFVSTGMVKKKVKTISLILMNSAGEIYVQKRDKSKAQSMGVFDRTTGGHVPASDTFERALARECEANLGIPAIIEKAGNFKDRARSSNLKLMAVCREVEYLSDFMSKKMLDNGDRYTQPYMNTVYVGYYDGDVKFINGKKSTIEKMSLEDLQELLNSNPYQLTHDLKFIINQYEDLLAPLND